VGNDALFRVYCGVIGQPLHEDPRFARNADRVLHRAALDGILEPLMLTRSVADWSAALDAAGVPGGPMSTVPEALERGRLVTHPHPAGGAPVRTCALPFAVGGAPRAAARRAPGLGEHTEEVIEEWLRVAPGSSGDKQEAEAPANRAD
jgi:crotonobetainyl-CoA:carnitine CoA-transferase CaiB-like acyl-CoA transferase